eukprot:TRINITY_DN17476_c0_g1_i1.p1 TRINITY_DN17476_c0_g1~~TRINITY_DN17476_c0_g1_i1.p1  ORF type:complete len:738 (+),score=158.94 TRINITY_DN17476_c0_g1_i1:41-2215(+)
MTTVRVMASPTCAMSVTATCVGAQTVEDEGRADVMHAAGGLAGVEEGRCEEEGLKQLPEPYREVYRGPGFDALSLLPPVVWVPRYIRYVTNRATEKDKSEMGLLEFSIKGDIIAGLTVGFMLVPQALAFALLAGLPIRTGLYSSVLPLVTYAVLGTIRQLQVGPTALISLLTGAALDDVGLVDAASRMSAAHLLALLVAAVTLGLGVVRFGFVIDFMSHSVMAAFVTAAGVTIATSQLKTMLGISIPRSKYWWQTVGDLLANLGDSDWPTALMGSSLLFFLVFMKAWKTAGNQEARQQHRVWRCLPSCKESLAFRSLKLLADLASVVSVILGWFWGAAYRAAGVTSVALVANTETEGVEFRNPAKLFNATEWSALFASAVTISLVGFIESVAVGGNLATKHRYRFDPNQELVALGLGNAASAIMAGFPITGGFSRTAVGALFGATSQLAGLIAACVVLVAMYTILPVVELLPKVALSPLIIQGAISVTSFRSFTEALHTSPSEFGIMMLTFLVSLALTVKEGLMVGLALSVLKLLHDVAVPNIAVCGRVSDGTFRDIRYYPEATMLKNGVVVRLDAAISFANARRFKEFCERAMQAKASVEEKLPEYLIMDFKSVNGVDISGVEMLESLAQILNQRGQHLLIANLKGPITASLLTAGLDKKLSKHKGQLCWNMEQAVSLVAFEGKKREDAQEAIDDLGRRYKSFNNNGGGSSSPGCLTARRRLI